MKSRLNVFVGRRVVELIFLGVLGMLLAGCAYPSPRGGGPANDEEPLSSDTLRTGDRVTVLFTDNRHAPDSFEQRIRADGHITLPYNQKIQAAGKTTGELQEQIRDQYVPNYFKELTVIVRSGSRYFTVSGEVKNPGQKTYVGDMTVTSAIAAAGDFTNYADKKSVEIVRANGRKLTVNAVEAINDPEKDLPIYPGDKVHVPLSWY